MPDAPLIAIIECGRTIEDIENRYGRYPAQFTTLLAEQGLRFQVVSIVDGAPVPSLDDADGFLITGSRHGVYDDLPWMAPLKALIRDAVAAKKPVAGICFGHQIMAEALGGKVEKFANGWALGPTTYRLTDDVAGLGDKGETIRINAVHQDQVVVQPPQSHVLAENEFCQFAALAYGEKDAPTAISIQPHPEFSADYTRDLIAARRGDSFPEPLSDAATATLDTDVLIDQEKGANWIGTFFRNKLSG